MRERLFIGGAFVDAADGRTVEVRNPHDGTVIANVAEADAVDVDRAVGGAKRAFPAWSRLAAAEPPDDESLAGGYYVEPTVVRAPNDPRVCREEVFGPFVTVATFRDDDEALALASSTDYGLGAGLWTRDLSRAHKVAGALRSGMIWVNSYKRVNPGSPFGGVGQSGQGREMGFEAMRQYTETMLFAPAGLWGFVARSTKLRLFPIQSIVSFGSPEAPGDP